MRNVASERARAKLTQKDLAEKLGVSSKTVSNWESEKSSIGSQELTALAELFGCTTDYLLGRTDTRK